MKAPSLVQFSQMLRVLAHPVSLRVVELLLDGERDVSAIGQALGLEGPAVSQHLSLLRAHRLVDQRRVGQRAFYRLSSDGLGRWLMAGSRLSTAEPLAFDA
jgi:DNA-binding transcriptional ArsR family regulator